MRNKKVESILRGINQNYYQIPYEDAKRNLYDEKIINDDGYIILIKEDVTNEEKEYTINFDETYLIFDVLRYKDDVYLRFIVVEYKTGKPLRYLTVDNDFYNYLQNSNISISNRELFELFVNEKAQFIKIVWKYKNTKDIMKYLNRKVKFVDPNTFAGSPGFMSISNVKWLFIQNILPHSNIKFLNKKRPEVAEYMYSGDIQPAIVISTSPLLISTYSDEMDGVIILKFPDEFTIKYNLKIGTRLVTSNVYIPKDIFGYAEDIMIGINCSKRYRDFIPVLGIFFTEDLKLYFEKVAKIPEETWARVYELTIEYRRKNPNLMRNGFFYLIK